MQNRIRPDVDVILDLLKEVAQAKPDSSFIQSLLVQYQERGGLSKKQLQGLLGHAQKIKDIPVNRIATLEAIILKKATKERSPLPGAAPVFKKDEKVGHMIAQLLSKYPAHKRVLYLKSKYDHDEPLSPTEISELQRFMRLLG